jgi:hypothetical protein
LLLCIKPKTILNFPTYAYLVIRIFFQNSVQGSEGEEAVEERGRRRRRTGDGREGEAEGKRRRRGRGGEAAAGEEWGGGSKEEKDRGRILNV